MKRLILLLPFLINATYFVSNSGNNTTGDGSRGTPWRDCEYADSQMSAGDTCVVLNDITEHPDWNPDSKGGTMEDPTVFIDVNRYDSGFNLRAPDSVWTKIDFNNQNYDLNLTSDNGYKFIGLFFYNTYGIFVRIASQDIVFLQCKFNGTSTSNEHVQLADGCEAFFYSCLFDANDWASESIYGYATSGAIDLEVINCTFKGGTASPVRLRGTVGGTTVFKNNIVYNDNVFSGQYIMRIEDTDFVDDIDYNIYYVTVADNKRWYNGSTSYTTLANWRTWIQANGDANGETNSSYNDPAMGDQGVIGFSSSAYDAGVSTSYTNSSKPSIGYWQPIPPISGRIIMIR